MEQIKTRRSMGRWYILVLISAMYLITYLDRVNISVAAPVISKEFGFDKITMGVIFSAFVWAYAMFQVTGGWLGDRFGARNVLTIIVSYWAIMTAATAAATGATSFVIVRFLFGIGEAGAFPGATRAMQLWYPPHERGFVQGITLDKAALVRRIPELHGAGCARKCASFADAKKKAKRHERGCSSGRSGRRRHDRPIANNDRQNVPRPEPIAEPAAGNLKHSVGLDKGAEDHAHRYLVEPEFLADDGRRGRDIDAIEVGNQVHQ